MKKTIRNFEVISGLIPAGCFIAVVSSVGSIAQNIVSHNLSGVINSIVIAIISIVVMKIYSNKQNATD